MTLDWSTRTLRGRLTVGHALIVLVSVIVFAFTARWLAAKMERSTNDMRIESTAAAITLLSTHQKSPVERAELVALTDPDLRGAIFDARGATVTTTAPVPTAVRAFAAQANTLGPRRVLKVEAQGVKFHVVAFPVNIGAGHGSAVLWRVVDTISDADNLASVVFAIAIPLIVTAALVAGNLLTQASLGTLEAITSTARTIEATDLSRRIEPIPRERELADLGETLNRMFARLEAAFERMRRFTADASHELRTPLSVIIAEADLGADGLGNEAEYRQTMHVILREAQTIETLTSDLLALAREEAGREPRVVPVDLATAAESAVERLGILARSRQMTVRAACESPAMIVGIPSSIARIPISLLHNAIKFSDEGSTIDIAVEVRAGTVRLIVEDQGPGFSDERLAHALDRFWSDKSRDQREGSGLGLAIVATLVESAHGTIELANRVPHGARVIVTFPTARMM